MTWNTYVSSGGVSSKTFATHASALEHYNNVKPIRGRAKELRPLGRNRKYTQCSIEHDPLTNGVTALLYGSPCLTIHDNGLIKIDRTDWLTPSTVNFIDAVLPSKWGRVYLKRRKVIYVTPHKIGVGDNGEVKYEKKEFVVPKGGLLLQASDDWETVTLVDGQASVESPAFEYKADRKVLNKIRSEFTAFMSAVDVMCAMSDTYTIGEVCEYFPQVGARYNNEYMQYLKADKEFEEWDKQPHSANEPRIGKPYFNEAWTLRDAVRTEVGAPTFERMTDLASTIKRQAEGSHGYKHWIDSYTKEVKQITLPRYLDILKKAKTDDAETIRKLILAIVTNANNYGQAKGYGFNTEKVSVDAGMGTKVEVPQMTWYMGKGAVKNYLTDVIKYIYADLIFKVVELPHGTLPKQTNEKYVLANEYMQKNMDIITMRYPVPV